MREGPSWRPADPDALVLYIDLAARGIWVEQRDEKLYVSPVQELTDDDRTQIRLHKTHLLDLTRYVPREKLGEGGEPRALAYHNLHHCAVAHGAPVSSVVADPMVERGNYLRGAVLLRYLIEEQVRRGYFPLGRKEQQHGGERNERKRPERTDTTDTYAGGEGQHG